MRSWSVEPEVFLHTWSARSRSLALALTMYEDSLGPNGFPLELEMDPDMDGWFEARPLINHATAAREQWQKDHEKADPGTVLTVVDTRGEDDEDDE